MKLHIDNLGPLKTGTFDLSKDLIVFTGPNNTGKTWVSYVIWWVFITRGRYFYNNLIGKYLKSNIDELLDTNSTLIDNDTISFFCQEVNKAHKIFDLRDLSELFAVNNEILKGTNVSIKFDIEKLLRIRIGYSINYYIKPTSDYITQVNTQDGISLEYIQGNSSRQNQDEYYKGRKAHEINNFFITELVKTFLFGSKINTFFSLTERSALSSFSKYLTKMQLNERNIFDELPRPISDAIEVEALKDSPKQFPFKDIAVSIEKDILKGTVSKDTDKELTFKPNNQDFELPIVTTASTIKSLGGLVHNLYNHIQKGDVLLIDEPEQNLHPNNRRIFLRYLVELANSGVKVIMSTHCDYILRELNNLIMLGSIPEGQTKKRDKIVKELNKEYPETPYQPTQFIKHTNVGAYYFDFPKGETMAVAEELTVKETGFVVKSIDATIRQQALQGRTIYKELYDE